jgi:hypothetical protein
LWGVLFEDNLGDNIGKYNHGDRNMGKPYLFLCGFLGLQGCVTDDEPFHERSVLSPRYYHHRNIPDIVYGDGKVAQNYHQFFVAGPLPESSLLYARASKVEILLDLRADGVDVQKLAAQSEKAGIQFTNLPVNGANIFQEEAFAAISQKLSESEDEHYLVVSDPADIAAAIVAAYIGERSNLKQEMTLEIAGSLGMNEGSIAEQLRQYSGSDGPSE